MCIIYTYVDIFRRDSNLFSPLRVSTGLWSKRSTSRLANEESDAATSQTREKQSSGAEALSLPKSSGQQLAEIAKVPAPPTSFTTVSYFYRNRGILVSLVPAFSSLPRELTIQFSRGQVRLVCCDDMVGKLDHILAKQLYVLRSHFN